jgi:hypothetical protein
LTGKRGKKARNKIYQQNGKIKAICMQRRGRGNGGKNKILDSKYWRPAGGGGGVNAWPSYKSLARLSDIKKSHAAVLFWISKRFARLFSRTCPFFRVLSSKTRKKFLSEINFFLEIQHIRH